MASSCILAFRLVIGTNGYFDQTFTIAGTSSHLDQMLTFAHTTGQNDGLQIPNKIRLKGCSLARQENRSALFFLNRVISQDEYYISPTEKIRKSANAKNSITGCLYFSSKLQSGYFFHGLCSILKELHIWFKNKYFFYSPTNLKKMCDNVHNETSTTVVYC